MGRTRDGLRRQSRVCKVPTNVMLTARPAQCARALTARPRRSSAHERRSLASHEGRPRVQGSGAADAARAAIGGDGGSSVLICGPPGEGMSSVLPARGPPIPAAHGNGSGGLPAAPPPAPLRGLGEPPLRPARCICRGGARWPPAPRPNLRILLPGVRSATPACA